MGRRRIHGPEAIVDHLSRPGPGAVHDWDIQEWPSGVALSFEWEGEGGVDRRRWYVRTPGDGRIEEIWSTAARPVVAGGDDAPSPPPQILERIGASAVEPLSHDGNSGAAVVRATGDSGSFVLKRVTTAGGDWLARVTHDEGRTALLYEAGAFERMPASVGHGIVTVEREGDAAWIAMRDIGALLLPHGRRISREESRRILMATADLHREFREDVPLGAATLADRIGMSTPAVGHAERHEPDLLPKQFEQGWDAFAELVDADVRDAVMELVASPERLADALVAAHGDITLLHGDVRGDNLGFDGGRLILIDWDLATAGTPTAEFAWYLAHGARRIDATHDEIEADYRRAEGAELADDEVELGMVSGLVQYGWRIAHSARVHPDPAEASWGRAELDWWVPRVRSALEVAAEP